MNQHDHDQALKSLWQSQALDADSVSLDKIKTGAQGFHAAITRRNRREEWACYLVMAIFSAYAWFLPVTLMRAGSVLVVLGTLVVLFQLRRQAAIEALPPEALAGTYVSYFRAQLVRQRDALRSVWLWYILPIVPGLVLYVWGMAQGKGGAFPWLMPFMFALPLLAVIGLNLWAASKLQRQIDALDASAR